MNMQWRDMTIAQIQLYIVETVLAIAKIYVLMVGFACGINSD
jgi:hypothetical protein